MIYNLDTVRDDLILDIGIQGEDNARQVKFDISAWLAAWPGVFSISCMRADGNVWEPGAAGVYESIWKEAV